MSERTLLTEHEREVLQADQHDGRTEVIDELDRRLTVGFADELAVLEAHAPDVLDRLIGTVDKHLANRYRERTD